MYFLMYFRHNGLLFTCTSIMIFLGTFTSTRVFFSELLVLLLKYINFVLLAALHQGVCEMKTVGQNLTNG